MGHEKVVRVRRLDWWVKANNMRSRTTTGGGGKSCCHHPLPIACCWPWLISLVYGHPGYFFVAHSVFVIFDAKSVPHSILIFLHVSALNLEGKFPFNTFVWCNPYCTWRWGAQHWKTNVSLCLSAIPWKHMGNEGHNLGRKWSLTLRSLYSAVRDIWTSLYTEYWNK